MHKRGEGTLEAIYPALLACALFRGFTLDDIRSLGERTRLILRAYTEGQIVAIEDEPCQALGMIIAGSVHIQRVYPSGKVVTLDTLGAGSSFGEALIFSDAARYPASVTAAQESTVVYFPREEVARLCAESPVFQNNFLRMLSDRILMLNRKIKNLSYGTVRQKVADFVLQEYRRQGSATLHLPYSRREMADALGLPQPSLSRELIAMRDRGWIDFARRTIVVRNAAALERSLGE
ncbi:MAG TPA: Crp/Fnr family transcriptional regulator [Anaerolineae bacterium]